MKVLGCSPSAWVLYFVFDPGTLIDLSRLELQLFQPIQTQLSAYVGMVICICAFVGVYANDIWQAKNFPFLGQLLYRENGGRYNQTMILNDDFTLNEEKLAAYGLPWFTATQTVTGIAGGLSFGATVTHIVICNGKQVWDAIQSARNNTVVDAHYEKMKAYKEVPFWWYTAMFVCSMAISLVTNYIGRSQLPWWAFFVAVGFATVFLPIIVTLYAVLCYVTDTENIARMLGAALVPGKPHVRLPLNFRPICTSLCTPTTQRNKVVRWPEISRWTPPRVTFTMQSVGAIIGALINFVIMKIVVSSNRELLLSVQGNSVWSGATVQSFNRCDMTRSIAWGALAKHLYSPSGRYAIIPFSILLGLVMPVPFWLLHQKFPRRGFDQVITPMICSAIGYYNTGINSATFTTFLLSHYRSPGMSAALDGGTEVMDFVFSFAVGGAGGKVTPFPNWALNPEGNPDYCKQLT
ncbi:peptide transporter mtd1 [Moniliophthora roreri MCA 2997]|uniref:Peptide transporter mtd1 n=2 Tax=Moniliophthora roreri TaxID=221103 RepID=V2XDC4_MONRO|nr:peptide transporter mtd1 [Moniliophthora roreri MCA 2997]